MSHSVRVALIGFLGLLLLPAMVEAQVATKQGGTSSTAAANTAGGVALVVGTPTAGDCLKWGASGGIADATAPCGSGGGSGITINSTSITGGTSGRLLYDNSGAVGETVVGTGVLSALGNSVGSAGAFTVFNGALGTPSSITLNTTNVTGIPLGTPGALSGILGVANGGTGTSSPAIVAGSNVTVTGSWPNQTISSTGSFTPPSRVYPGSTSATSADNNGSILISSAGTVTLSAYSGIVTGTRIDIISITTGLVSISGASTFNSWTNLAGQYAGATCIYNSSWYCSGALGP